MKQQCNYCKFWDSDHNVARILQIGRCRRYPPTFDLITILREMKEWPENGCAYPGQEVDPSSEFQHPVTTEHDWCGEFKPES